jgi:hypothetical protein
MSTPAYDEVLRLAEGLTTRERERLVQDISAVLSHDGSAKSHTIQEFRGCGKEMWRAMDTDEYVRRERDDWDG